MATSWMQSREIEIKYINIFISNHRRLNLAEHQIGNMEEKMHICGTFMGIYTYMGEDGMSHGAVRRLPINFVTQQEAKR